MKEYQTYSDKLNSLADDKEGVRIDQIAEKYDCNDVSFQSPSNQEKHIACRNVCLHEITTDDFTF